MIDLGDTVTLTASPRDGGNPVDVVSVALAVTLPDGTTSTAITVSHDGTGAYSAKFTPTVAGRHLARWTGTGFAYSEPFTVWPADPGLLFSVTEAKAALRRTGGALQPGDDDERIRLYIAAATSVIEGIVGPVVPRTVVETVSGRADSAGRGQLILAYRPLTVTSIVGQRAGLYEPDLSSLVIDPATGGLILGNWYEWYGPVTVTYTAGMATIPPNVLLAAQEELRFLWQLGQQANRPAFGDADDASQWAPGGFAVPRRVIELCAPHRQIAGIA